MYVCTYARMYVYMYYVCMHLHMYVCTYVRMYVCIMYVLCMYVCIMYVCMYAFTHVCMSITYVIDLCHTVYTTGLL